MNGEKKSAEEWYHRTPHGIYILVRTQEIKEGLPTDFLFSADRQVIARTKFTLLRFLNRKSKRRRQ